MMIAFECYDVYDKLIPHQTHDVASLFNCETKYTLGVWIRHDPKNPNRVVPVYLTETQFTNMKEEYNRETAF